MRTFVIRFPFFPLRLFPAFAFALLAGHSLTAQAAGLGGLPFPIDPSSFVSDDISNALVKLVGLSLAHRPYEPATALGTHVGLDLSLEVTLVKIPDSFFATLASSGVPLAAPAVPALPSAKLHLHKGMGERLDIGGSFLYVPSIIKAYGADVKIVILQGEEGPTYAVRLCYTSIDLSTSGIEVAVSTYAPQLLMSRQMEFADPYLGIGLDYTSGDIDANVPPPSGVLPPGIQIPTAHKTGYGYGALVFGGVSLRIPETGLRITLEGAYSSAGASSMGTKIGFTF